MVEQFARFSDKELVEKAKENPDFFGELISRHWDKLFGFLRRIFYLENEDLEDILQEVFLKAYRNLNDFDNSFAFSTWIYSIARNHAIDYLRKHRRKLEADILDDGQIMQIMRSEESPEKDLSKKQDLEKIRRAIGKLDLKYREVLLLRFLEEKSYQEIMDIVQKPKGTVAALINRGRKQLLEQLEEV
jgi:RNA polymerase sigma-70 factor (ECF subfamily)